MRASRICSRSFWASSDNPGLSLDAPGRADALLVNLESKAECKRFLDWYASREPCPVVAVTGDFPAPDSMMELRRPLHILSLRQTLRRLAQKLAQRRKEREAASETARASGSGLKMAPSELRTLIRASTAEHGVIEKPVMVERPHRETTVGQPLLRWSSAEKETLMRDVCGSLPDLDPALPTDRARLSISLEGQFVTWARAAVAQGREAKVPVRVTGIPGQFIYYPQQDSFSYDLEPDFLLQMAASRFVPGELGCQLLELSDPVDPQSPRDEVLWLLMLFTTRGRLPDYLEPTGRYRLKPVGDLARFLLPPHAGQVAGLWQQAGRSPIEISHSLHIAQRYVFSFLAAADAVDLFERK